MTNKLSGLALAVVTGVVATACSALAADPPKSVRIGYAISLSGPNAQGAAITTLSGYKLWVDDVEQEGWPQGPGLRQTNSDRGGRIRRHQQCRERGAAGRATDDPGQGRFRAAAVEHRFQSRNGAGVRSQRLSAACGDGQLQRRGKSGQADADAVLFPQRAAPFRRRARRGVEQAQEREQQDQQQDRDAEHRRSVRRRVHVGRHSDPAKRGLRVRPSQELSRRLRSISRTKSRRPRPPVPTASSPTAIRPTLSC